MTLRERQDIMVDRYGEVCTRAEAGRILGRDSRTVKKMIDDGRIESACAGTMVDVRSIAEYIAAPAQKEEDARVERVRKRYNTLYAV